MENDQITTNPTPRREVPSTQDDRLMALFCHLGGFFTSFIVPLILWLVQKDKSPFVNHHGKEALNFQLSLLVYYLLLTIVWILLFILLGARAALILGLLPVLGLMGYETIIIILASMAAYQGREFHCPLNIPFIR